MGLTTAAAGLLAAAGGSGGGGFQPPTVEESFFSDRIGDGSVVDSVKVLILLVIGTAFIIWFFIAASRKAAIVPTKFQFIGESIYGFVRNSIAIEVMGKLGRGWAPFLATQFVFILVMNTFEIIPIAEHPVTSHAVFPGGLALLTWILYNFVGIKKHGLLRYLKHTCVIPGIPWPVHFLLIPLEFFSKIVLQPFTLGVRLFANMFAGHMLVGVAAVGTIYFLESGGIGYAWFILPGLASVALWFFELLICALQAYVFTLLTAIYIEEAASESH